MIKCEAKKLNVQHIRLLLLLFIITALSFTSNAQAKGKRYPGKLVDIGTHRLHINCVGEGTPSVIIDSGIGGFSLEWITIQNSLADNVRVCSYDRAGYGWSDPGPAPRTTARIAEELRTLLIEARIPGPYLLVGHSFGGYNIRYFASEYPELTAGLVLIDSSHPEQFNTEEFKRIKPKPQLENLVKRNNSIRIRMVHPIIANNYPQETKRAAALLMMTMKSKSTLINELDYMETSAKQVSERTNHQPYEFPVIIITRGKRVWPENELGDRREQQWSRLQNDLLNISLQSDHFLAYESGHIIHLDQPELVSENIQLAVNKSRAQILENELIDKFDIRLANYPTIPSFAHPETTFKYNAIDSDEHSILNKSIHQVMFDSKSRYFGKNSNYFLR
jgi:pimeloyl-ACP methyl ester carboxylesterase